jgi:hypothetical protein
LRVQRNTSARRLQIDEIRTVRTVPPVMADDPNGPLYGDVIRLLDGVDIDPDDFPVEEIELPDLCGRLWGLTKAHASISVHHVFPCAACSRPIVCLHLDGSETWMIVDAVESSSECWTANLFDTHRCPEVVQ